MNVVQGFKIAPGCCHVCSRSDASLWVVDTRKDDLNAVLRRNVYICQDCAVAMVTQLSPYIGLSVTSNEVVASTAAVLAERADLVERCERAEGLLRTLGEMANEAVAVTT